VLLDDGKQDGVVRLKKRRLAVAEMGLATTKNAEAVAVAVRMEKRLRLEAIELARFMKDKEETRAGATVHFGHPFLLSLVATSSPSSHHHRIYIMVCRGCELNPADLVPCLCFSLLCLLLTHTHDTNTPHLFSIPR
jgi:hypothetical protein